MFKRWKHLTPTTGNRFTNTGSIVDTAEFIRRLWSSMTSFDELHTASAKTIIDLKSVYPISRLRDYASGTNGGGVDQSSGEFRVFTTDDPNSTASFVSVERGRYIAGYDAIPGMGIRLPTRPVGDQFVEFGYTDFVDGFVVGEDSTGIYTALYRGGDQVQKRYRQDWKNPLTTGGFVYDPTEINIYRMDFRWYGRGPYTLKIAGEDVNDKGSVYTADVMKGTQQGTITENANMPLSVRIENAGATTPLEVFVAGRQFFIVGDYNPERRITTSSRIEQIVGTTFTPMVSYRQKGGIYESIAIKLSDLVVLASGSSVEYEIRVFSELDGAIFEAPPRSDGGVETAAEFDTSATGFLEDGIRIYSGIAVDGQGNSAAGNQINLPTLDLPSDGVIVSVCARAFSGTATVSSVLRIREEW